MSQETIALSVLLLAQVVETGLLDGFGAGLGMLLVDVVVDELHGPPISLGDPRRGGTRASGRGSAIDCIGSIVASIVRGGGGGGGGGVED